MISVERHTEKLTIRSFRKSKHDLFLSFARHVIVMYKVIFKKSIGKISKKPLTY